MRAGEYLELAIWYDSNNSKDPIEVSRDSIKDTFDTICSKNNVMYTDIEFTILSPGDNRVPKVPLWLETIKGAIPKLLMARTKVQNPIFQKPKGIIGDLDKKDVIKLRQIIKTIYKSRYPNNPPISDMNCDQMIDELGMEVVMNQLRSSVIN